MVGWPANQVRCAGCRLATDGTAAQWAGRSNVIALPAPCFPIQWFAAAGTPAEERTPSFAMDQPGISGLDRSGGDLPCLRCRRPSSRVSRVQVATGSQRLVSVDM